MIQVHILFWIIRDGKKFGEVSFENLIFGVHFNFVVEVMFDFFFLFILLGVGKAQWIYDSSY